MLCVALLACLAGCVPGHCCSLSVLTVCRDLLYADLSWLLAEAEALSWMLDPDAWEYLVLRF